MNSGVPRLLDLQTVAQLWSVSPHTVRKWVKLGKLHPVHICRRLLFDPSECARFLRAADHTNGCEGQIESKNEIRSEKWKKPDAESLSDRLSKMLREDDD